MSPFDNEIFEEIELISQQDSCDPNTPLALVEESIEKLWLKYDAKKKGYINKKKTKGFIHEYITGKPLKQGFYSSCHRDKFIINNDQFDECFKLIDT